MNGYGRAAANHSCFGSGIYTGGIYTGEDKRDDEVGKMKELKLVYRGRLPAMNEIIGANRRNFYMGNKLKQKTQQDIMTQFLPQKRGTEFQEKVNMRIWFYEPNQRRDEDNVKSGLKFLLDALQELKILKNDSPRYLHIVSDEVFVDRENPRIEIELEEI